MHFTPRFIPRGNGRARHKVDIKQVSRSECKWANRTTNQSCQKSGTNLQSDNPSGSVVGEVVRAQSPRSARVGVSESRVHCARANGRAADSVERLACCVQRLCCATEATTSDSLNARSPPARSRATPGSHGNPRSTHCDRSAHGGQEISGRAPTISLGVLFYTHLPINQLISNSVRALKLYFLNILTIFCL